MIGGTAPISTAAATDFAAAGRMPDMHSVPQVERVSEFCDVGRIGVHLIAGIGLSRAAVAAPVVRDDAKALAEEEHHLVVPVVGGERPTMVKHDWLGVLRPPVLEVNLCAVARGDHGHDCSPCVSIGKESSFPESSSPR
jgi:hypothetical protein